MAENYEVNYIIKVDSINAQTAITSFQTAITKLKTASDELDIVKTKIDNVVNSLKSLSRKAPVLDVSTSKVHKKLDRVIAKLEKIHTLGGKTIALGGTTNEPTKAVLSSTTKNTKQSTKSTKQPSATRRNTIIPSNIGYKVLGPSMIDSGGVGAFNFVKGMGIAYGLSGLGSLMSNTLKEAVEYDNLMQTTKNILQTHDKLSNFENRFANMAQTVRNVGVETKFTSQQVADAAKFLAMAGFDISGINQSIRPIADIALVGDTDLGATADVVTNIMTGYGISPSQVRNAADIMTMTFTKSNTTLMEMAEAYKYSASLLSAGGVAFEESTAALGILGDAGIKGSQAGTTLRTIMANLVNPTKKQLSNWNRIGVSRYDKNGNLRQLSDIFGDLRDADLQVDDFYKLFHKTAGAGAVSLANNVDKWNEIIELNFMSDGLVAKLAEEKKNTIAGLWAQLTSAFTENGLKAFEDMQGPIKHFLKEITNWLMSEDAEKLMKSLINTVFDLIKMLIDFTKVCMYLYERFGGWIKGWIKLQVVLTAIITPLRIVKSLFNFGAFIVVGAKNIGLLTANIGKLFATVRTGAGLKGVLQGVLQGFYSPNISEIAFSRGYGEDVVLRYNRMQYGKSRGQTLSNWKLRGLGAATVVSGALGALGGSYIGEEGSGWSVFGSAVGGILGSLAPAGLLKLWPLISHPIGIGVAIIAGLAAATVGIVNYYKEVDKAVDANLKLLGSMSSINGINYSEHATKRDKYLQIVHNKQLDVNEAISAHINLIKEQLGLLDGAKTQTDPTPFKESHKDIFEQYSKPYSLFSYGFARENAVGDIYKPDGSINTDLSVTKITRRTPYGDMSCGYKFNSIEYCGAALPTLSKVGAGRFLYQMGADTSEGTELRKAIDDFNKQFFAVTTVAGLKAAQSQLEAYQNKKQTSIIPSSEYWDWDVIGDNNWSTNQTGYHYVTGLINELGQQMNFETPQTANAQLLATWKKILEAHETRQKVPNDLLENFLELSGIDIFNKGRNYGDFGTDGFMKKFGYVDGEWRDDYVKVKMLDEHGNVVQDQHGKDIEYSLSKDQARKAFLEFHNEIISAVNQVHPSIRPYFESYINHPVWALADTTAPNKGAKVFWDKINWEFDGSVWQPKSGSGWSVAKALTITEMNRNLATLSTPTPTIDSGGDSSDYKSHYKNNSPVPKQVIVKIDNLLNVESVDLSNPDNAYAVNNLKDQVAQALVDVVHDFDATFNV